MNLMAGAECMHYKLPTCPRVCSQNRVLPERWVYAASLAPFLSYYAIFAAVLYPLSSIIHPTHLLDSLRTALPQGLVGLASTELHLVCFESISSPRCVFLGLALFLLHRAGRPGRHGGALVLLPVFHLGRAVGRRGHLPVVLVRSAQQQAKCAVC
eukprot:1159976-Pelagomonas_calceolata.AAC.2